MHKSFPHLLPSLIFAIMLFFIPGWNDASAYSTDAETQGVIFYVKPGANGNCTSWADACELQTALLTAVTGDQIWVAAGTYKPTTSTLRTPTFQLKTGVAIYGGFPAAGGEWLQRNWVANLTILSGDIGLIDNTEDNSFHVVTGSGVDSTAALDGFTVTAGNANGAFPDNYGGGMFNETGSPTLSNIIFSTNLALFGGGLSNTYSSNPLITEVTFVDNSASEYGGGLYNKYSSSPTSTNLTFLNNSAKYGGGLANNDNSSPTITESFFIENSASVSGGGIWNYNNSNLTLTDISFISNSASNGGGIWNEESVLTLMRASFVSNSATQSGGGIKFHFCGIDSFLQNVTFSNNSANNRGGGLLNHYSSPRLVNVTFAQNSSDFDGGGIFNEYNSHPTMKNSILWGNTPDQIYSDSNSSMPVTYSIVERGYPGEGNLDLNPLLGTLQNNGGFSETHALQADSPAVDAGNPDTLTCPEIDQRTLPRPVDGNGDSLTRCDMGSYEVQPYLLTMGIIGNGEVEKFPDQPDYALSQQVTLTPTADPGWTFLEWGGDATGSNNPLSYTIVGNTSITGTFTQDEYTLTITPIGSGLVSVDPVQATYHYGDVVTLTSTADPGWTFFGWGGDASGSANPLTTTIQGNTTITATYTQDEYTLTITPIGSGTVAIDPVQATYIYGDVVTLTPTADTGWTFTGWGGDAPGSANPLNHTIIGNTTITATFTQDEYTLNVTPVGSGTVTLDPVKATYQYGDLVTLTATANPGWTFFEWGGDASGSENPLTYTIVGNTSVMATFTQDDYTLIVTVIGSGTVYVDPIQTTYHYGDLVTLTAIADPAWTFSGWSGDASGSDNPLTIMIDGNSSITATFSQDEYSLTVTPIGSGMVTVDPDQLTYHYGDVVTLTPTADPGWTFDGWGGDASGSDNPLTYTIIGDTSITANFSQNEYTLAVDIAPVGSGTVIISPLQTTYHYGDEVTLTPVANPGWTFLEWTGDASDSDNPLTVTIHGDTNITANFMQDQYTLAVTIEGYGSVAIDPVQATYIYGTEVTLTATADQSWSFAGWGGDASGSDNPLTFTIQGDTSIVALFTTNWIFLPMITR